MGNTINKNMNETSDSKYFSNNVSDINQQSVFGNVNLNINNNIRFYLNGSNSVLKLMVNNPKDFFKHVENNVNIEDTSNDNNDLESEIIVNDVIEHNNLTETINEIKETSMISDIISKSTGLNEIASDILFLQMNYKALFGLISNPSLKINSEEDKIHALKKWINFDFKTRKKFLCSLLKLVKFPLLKIEFILDEIYHPCENCCQTFLDIMIYNYLPERRTKIKSFSISMLENVNKLDFSIFILKCEEDFISNKVEIYNSMEKSWKHFFNIDNPTISPAFIIMKDSLCIMGGLQNNNNILSRVIFVNIKTKEKEIFHLNNARAAAAAVVAKGILYITGGITTKGPIKTAESWGFLLGSWKMIKPMNIERWNHASVEFKSRVFVSGGEDHLFRRLNTCESYDPISNTWDEMVPMLSCRSKHQLLVLNNEIYALGGYDGDILASVEKYVPNEKRWISLADLPFPMYGQRAIVYQNKIVYFFEDYAYEYNSKTNNWDRSIPLDKIDKNWKIIINPNQSNT